jgi:hypothetical protein
VVVGRKMRKVGRGSAAEGTRRQWSRVVALGEHKKIKGNKYLRTKKVESTL